MRLNVLRHLRLANALSSKVMYPDRALWGAALLLALLAVPALAASSESKNGGAFSAGPASMAVPANTLQWNTNRNVVSADIRSATLYGTLNKIAAVTGWRIYMEPGTTHTVSTRFNALPTGEALRLLLGKLSYALVPESKGGFRLFVFRTSQQNATELVPGNGEQFGSNRARRIGNELVVRLRDGANIDDLAKRLGARVTGRIDSMNAYRLEFDDESSADGARQKLDGDSDVEAVDNNFEIAQPPSAQQATGMGMPPPVTLQLAPPPENGKIVVGLIDTAVQSLGNGLDPFILEQLSVTGQGSLDPSSPSHGTSMAETILRSLQEITNGKTSVQILPVDVYGAGGQTTTFTVSEGIVRAVNAGARVINLSLGSEGDDTVLRNIISEVSKKNITIFAAAGNQPVSTPVYPAAYDGVNAVTALERGQVAPYANRGEFVSLGAPGTSIIYFQGRPYQITGTSPASATAAGYAAGYMETSGGNTAQTQEFMQERFGIRNSPPGGK